MEAAHAGDPPDPSRYRDEPVVAGVRGDDPRRANDHDAVVGGPDPVRISGFSAWADTAATAAAGPAGEPGPWLRVDVRVLNRDDGPQGYTYTDWTLVGPDGVAVQATLASKDFADGTQLAGNAEVDGELWFHPRADGRHWLVYRPQQDRDRGIWAVDVPAA